MFASTPPSRFRALTPMLSLMVAGLILSSQCRAVDYIWSAGAAGNWSAATNWTPNGIPGAADTVTFNGTSVMNATIDTNVSVLGVTLATGYTGTVSFTNNATLTIGANGYAQTDGAFNFSASGGVSCASNWIATGGTATWTTTTVVLNFNEPAGNFTFTQQGGKFATVTHSGAGTLQCVDMFGFFAQGTFTQSGPGSIIFSDKNQIFLGDIVLINGSMDVHSSPAMFGGIGKNFTQTGGNFVAPAIWNMRGVFSSTGGTFVAGGGSFIHEPQTTGTLDCGSVVFNNYQYLSLVNTTLINHDFNCTGTFTFYRQDGRLGIFDCNGRNVSVGGLTTITNGTLNCGSGKLNLTGGLLIGGSTVPNALLSSSGTVNVMAAAVSTADLTLQGTTGMYMGIGTLNLGTGTLNVSGNFQRLDTFGNPSVFSAGTSTINFNKISGVQTYENAGSTPTLFNVTHSGAGTFQILNNEFDVNGAFVNSGGTFQNNNQNVFCNGTATLICPAGGISVMDVGSGNLFFESTLSIQGATVTTGLTGTAYYQNTVTASNGPGGDKPTLAGNVNLFGVTDVFDVAAGSELLVPGSIANGALTKSSAGQMTLTNVNNTYTGATNILGGTLVVNSLQPQSTVTVNASATLAGNGTVGPVTVANGGALSPAAGPNAGALTAMGNAMLSAGSTYKVGLRGTAPGQFDKFFVQGTVSLDGTALTGTATPFPTPPGTKLVILDNNGTDAIVGTFTGQPEGSTVNLSGRLFKISYVGGSGNDVELTTINSAPTFSGSLSATPNPAAVGQNISFTAAAADVDGDTLTYTWDFGDGSNATGASVSHIYAAAGTFTATVSVSDGTAAPIASSISVTIVTPLVGTGSDTDGDGFSDSFETAVGTLPGDATSTPFGGGPATAPLPLTLSKPTFALNFAKAGTDAIKFGGTLDIPAGFVPTGKKVYVDVGGVAERFTLDSKGSAKGGLNGAADTLKITIKVRPRRCCCTESHVCSLTEQR